jgi:type II secretion system protein N
MAGRILRTLVSWAWYFLYTLVVLICLLWFMFPGESVQKWMEQQLDNRYPEYHWTIESVKLGFPGSLVVENIELRPPQGKIVLLQVERLAVVPDILKIIQNKKSVKYAIDLLQGSIQGQVEFSPDWQQYEGEGTFADLHLEELEMLQQSLQREVNGILSGTYSSKGDGNVSGAAEIKGKLSLADGIMEFKAPVLGLDTLAYTTIETDFGLQKGQWLFEQGKLQSPGMSAQFNGQLEPGLSLAAAQLQFTGTLVPRSELFAEAKNKQMAQVVRIHLKDGGLPFTVSGTAGEPGIHFVGALSQALKNLPGSTK